MRSHDKDGGQIYTMEGIIASFILLSVLLFILQSNSIIVPQTERAIDMKLFEKAGDTLVSLDRSDNDSWSAILPLKTYVADWNGAPGTLTQYLEQNISDMLPSQVDYNLEFKYNNATGLNRSVVIDHGTPNDNSVVAVRFVTLNNDDISAGSNFWKNINAVKSPPQVVEVKLICWYV